MQPRNPLASHIRERPGETASPCAHAKADELVVFWEMLSGGLMNYGAAERIFGAGNLIPLARIEAMLELQPLQLLSYRHQDKEIE